MMELYLAPMESITGYIYRNAHQEFFGTIDTYVTPFISPNQNRCFNFKEKNDILPEHNRKMHVVPQIMTNKWEDFVQTCKELQEFGYEEVNLNLGCPSRTVVTKNRGSGFLRDADALDEFFENVFKRVEVQVSVKTRLGLDDSEEFREIMKIYRRYPLKELMIHPRVQADFYNNSPDMTMFQEVMESLSSDVDSGKQGSNSLTTADICYNGDIFTKQDYDKLTADFPKLRKVMLGRGILMNPNLPGEIKDGRKADKETFRKFHERLFENYKELLSGDRNLLFKMKELWFYLHHSFTNSEKYYKKIRKTEKLAVYMDMVKALFDEQELVES